MAFQSRLQPTSDVVTHSAQARNLVALMEFMDVQSIFTHHLARNDNVDMLLGEGEIIKYINTSVSRPGLGADDHIEFGLLYEYC